MEISELRLGNFIHDDEFEICRVERIESESFNIYNGVEDDKVIFSKSGTGFYTSYKTYPIRITHDWLLKFGFKKQSEYLFYKGEIALEWATIADVFILRIRYSDTRSLPMREVKYVHELQNILFALTGEEL